MLFESAITLPLSSANGGTGLSNPTAHRVMVAEGASNMTPIVLSTGQIFIGSTGADPVAAAINSGTGILVGNGADITVSLAAIATLNILSNITGGSASPIANTLTATIDAAMGDTQGNIFTKKWACMDSYHSRFNGSNFQIWQWYDLSGRRQHIQIL